MNSVLYFQQDVNSPDQFNLLTYRKQQVLLQWVSESLTPYRIKTFNEFHSSHLLKSIFTKCTGMYITNGEFKGALLRCGFKVKNDNHMNWVVNISKKRVNELMK